MRMRVAPPPSAHNISARDRIAKKVDGRKPRPRLLYSPLRMLASDYASTDILSRDACRNCHKASSCGAVT